jgi:hypothetical protein
MPAPGKQNGRREARDQCTLLPIPAMNVEDDLATIDTQLAHTGELVAELHSKDEDLLAQRRQLCTRRNEVASPLCRLPVEIVQNIVEHLISPFFSHVDDVSTLPEGEPQFSDTNGWIVVAGVCTRLRAVILASGHLWARIDWTSCKQWRDLCIERAGSAPLHIHTSAHRAIHEPLAAWIPRAHTLVLHTDHFDPEDAHALAMALDRPAPLLHTLYYTSMGRSRRPNFRLNALFFMGGQTSSLTRLVLVNVPSPSSGLCFPALIHLDIYDCVFSDVLEANALLDLVAAAPQLERLFLNFIDLAYELPISIPRSRLVLPRLSYLGLSATVEALQQFMPHLPTPTNGYLMKVDGPVSAELHIQLLRCALEAFGLPADVYKTSRTPVLNLHRKLPEPSEHYEMCLRVERGDTPGGMAYEDHSWTITRDNFGPILDQARALRVHGRAFEPLFIYATRPRTVDPALAVIANLVNLEYFDDHALAALEHLILEDFDSQLCFFRDWLAERVRVGRPLQSIEFRGKQSYVADHGTVAELGRRMLEAGAVKRVWINGRPLRLDDVTEEDGGY